MWDFSENERTENTVNEEIQESENNFQNLLESKKEELQSIISENKDFEAYPDINQILSNGITMLVGDKQVKFEVTDIQKTPTDEVYQKAKELYQNKLYEIWEKITSKIEPLSEEIENIKEKLDHELRKSKNLNKKRQMPELTEKHISEGLTVAPGKGENEIYWYVDGIYYIDTVDGKKLPENVSKATKTPTKMLIVTNGNMITGIKTKKWSGEDFLHYHSIESGTEDCWGNFNTCVEWESPDDILHMAKRAFTVLSDINTDSLGDSNPPNLPAVDKLENSINNGGKSEYFETFRNTQAIFARMGLGEVKRDESDYVWNLNNSSNNNSAVNDAEIRQPPAGITRERLDLYDCADSNADEDIEIPF